MFQVFSTVAAPRPDPWWHRWRLPLLLATLGVVLYYTAFTYFLVPFYGFTATWEPDNVLTVSAIPAGREAAPYLRPGDQILAIDGIPARQRLWQPLFAAGKTEYEYTIGRAGQQFIVTIPVEQVTVETWLEVVQNRRPSDWWPFILAGWAAVILLPHRRTRMHGWPGNSGDSSCPCRI